VNLNLSYKSWYQTYDPKNLPSFFTKEMRNAARRLDERELRVSLGAVGIEMRNRDPFSVPETEKAFLSSLLSGGLFPAEFNVETLLVPRHRVIFEALRTLANLKLLRKWDENLPLLKNLLQGAGLLEAAGGPAFLQRLESVYGIPAAASGLADAVTELRGQGVDCAANCEN
jgi:hypothetical protein